jgi:hypothetical protein
VGTERETLGRWRAWSQGGDIAWAGGGMVVGHEGLMSMGMHGYGGYTQAWGHVIAWAYGVGLNRNN